MSIIRWNPLREASSWNNANTCTPFNRELDQMMNQFFRTDVVEDPNTTSWLPAVDIVEQENEYLVHLELPGVDKNNVKINIANSVLTIKGEKQTEKDEQGKNYHHKERLYGSFQRSFTLPTTVKADKIEATYENGVLSVVIPKAEEAKPKEIEVQVK